jgi:D-3-phosphoglycerate dehydrogenase
LSATSAPSRKVLITDYDFPDLDLEIELFERAGVECVTAQCRSEAEVVDAAQGCFGILVQYAPINARVFAERPEIRIVSRYGAGFDTVSTDDAKAAGVWVANSPDYGIGEVATHALGMTLSLLRHIHLYGRAVRAGSWHYLSAGTIPRVADLTLGILGLGRIGKRMAHIAGHSFGRVIACDPYIAESDFPVGVKRVSIEALFEQSNAVSIHVPLNAETRGLVDGPLLRRMPRGSVLVNTARGPIVNTRDLLEVVSAGLLDGAALDVLPIEPPAADDPVVQHERILCTPHAAFYSVVAERELRRKAAENLIQWLQHGKPRYVVVAGSA